MESDLRGTRCVSTMPAAGHGEEKSKRKSNEKDEKTKKNKAKTARHSRSISSQPPKDQRKLSFFSGWLWIRSFRDTQFLTITTPSSPSTALYNLFIPPPFPLIFSPSTASSGLVFLVRLGSGFVFCTVLFIFCVSEHISLLEDCFGSELKQILQQILQRFTGRVLETVDVVD